VRDWQPTVRTVDHGGVSISLACPMCGLPIIRQRPPLPGEQPRQSHLPAGWDCSALHAAWVPPDMYEAARMQRLIADVDAFIHPEAVGTCSEHLWILSELAPEFTATRCAKSDAVGYLPASLP
jgi:hypothetical protein